MVYTKITQIKIYKEVCMKWRNTLRWLLVGILACIAAPTTVGSTPALEIRAGIQKRGFLVYIENGKEYYLYRCLLHDPRNPNRSKIPAARNWESYVKGFIMQWQPIVDVALPNDLPQGFFDLETRQPIGEDTLHLRYNKWQLYIYRGANQEADQSVAALWEPVRLDVILNGPSEAAKNKETLVLFVNPPPAVGP
jgi:hypothetical protein